MGTRDGSIIATIITTHMPRNDAAAPGHVCPGIRIHAIDIVQPPGIGISPIADMDAPQTIVTAALAAKSSAETPKKARWEARLETMRREISRPAVAPTTPTTSLSASRTRRGDATRGPSRCAPWGRGRATGTCPRGRPVRAHRWNRCGRRRRPRARTRSCPASRASTWPRRFRSWPRTRAHARPLARVRGRVGSGHGRVLGDGLRDRCRVHRVTAAPVVVFDAPLALLLLGERDVEVDVEVAAARGRPGKRPAHPPLVRLQLRERRARHRPEHHVMVGQVDGDALEPVRDRRAGRTPRRVVGPEHEVVDEELRAPSEEVRQRGAPLVGFESIRLVDPNPRQRLPPPRQLVAAPREFLLRLEQLEPCCEPLFTCSGLVCRHRRSLPSSDVLVRSVLEMTWWFVVMRYI